MRIRTIKPEFWMHEGLCQCSEFTRLLAIALLNWADDEGYFLANPILIRGQVFPFLDDSKIIPRSLQDLSRVGWIDLGKDEQGRDVGRIANFLKHQRVDKAKPSQIKVSSVFQDASKTHPRTIQDASKEEGKGIEGNMEGNGKDSLSDESDDGGYSSYIEKLWMIFPPMSRNRSSKAKLDKAWKATKPKPNESTVMDCLQKWAASHAWTKDGGQFAPGAHVWIKDRKWESEPEDAGSQVGGEHKGMQEGIPF